MAEIVLEDFLARPTEAQWGRALAQGWPGPDGSSSSLDNVEGVRIGITSPDFQHSTLPANLHDWRYLLGRTFSLPSEYRAAADAEYRDGCIAAVGAVLIGWHRRKGTLRAHVRYAALRVAGWPAWTRGFKLSVGVL